MTSKAQSSPQEHHEQSGLQNIAEKIKMKTLTFNFNNSLQKLWYFTLFMSNKPGGWQYDYIIYSKVQES